MKKHTITSLVVAAAAVAVLALASGVASASPASHAAAKRVVVIAMHDPGCHWFQAGGKFEKRLVVKRATAFRNLDEAALVFKGAGFNKQLPVGKTLTVSKPGTYHITMVHQAPDDNHLVLIVK